MQKDAPCRSAHLQETSQGQWRSSKRLLKLLQCVQEETWQIVWQWLCLYCVGTSLHHRARDKGTMVSWQTWSTPAYTHMPRPPVSQTVINRPKQQVLSLCLLLTANYEALQVCPANHTTVNPISVPSSSSSSSSVLQPLLSLLYICLHLEARAFSQTHKQTKEEKTQSWKCYQVNLLLWLGLSTSALSLNRMERSGGKNEVNGIWKGKECVDKWKAAKQRTKIQDAIQNIQ